MCGIAGVLHFNGEPVSHESLRGMAATLRHRGPDRESTWAEARAGVGFGHTRLRVIDLETGAQPMLLEQGRLVIVFNGEIYNFRELRDELAACGHRFRTSSDTEVILHAYDRWGDACVEHLDGMFAFAVWDARRRYLFLARDAVGKKPLYIYQDSRCLAFASEPKAFWAMPRVDDSVDVTALPLYLTYGYVPAPRTFFTRVRKLAPGSVLTAAPGGGITERQYAKVGFSGGATRMDSGEARERLRELFFAAVRKRLVADVPLGAFLSGGIDSTLVVGAMSRMSAQPVRTFSIGFSDAPEFDETATARATATRLGTDHTEFIVEPETIGLLDSLVDAYDEPFGDSSAIPTSIVSRLSRESVTVALTGDGGDELFAGYLRLHAGAMSERIPRSLRLAGAAVARELPAGANPRGLPARTTRFLGALGEPLIDRYLQWIGIFPNDAQQLIRTDLRNEIYDRAATRESFARVLTECRDHSTLDRLLTLNFRTYLLDDLLIKADRCSMAHGLELRSPFLDRALIDFATRLPNRMLMRRGATKYVVRKAFSDLIPRELLRRGKMGFGIPLDRWLRNQWEASVAERLLQSNSAIYSWLDKKAVSAAVAQHMSGRANLGHQLWALLTLESWLARRERTLHPCITPN